MKLNPRDGVIIEVFKDYLGIAPISAIFKYVDDYVSGWGSFAWRQVRRKDVPKLYKCANSDYRYIDDNGIEYRSYDDDTLHLDRFVRV